MNNKELKEKYPFLKEEDYLGLAYNYGEIADKRFDKQEILSLFKEFGDDIVLDFNQDYCGDHSFVELRILKPNSEKILKARNTFRQKLNEELERKKEEADLQMLRTLKKKYPDKYNEI